MATTETYDRILDELAKGELEELEIKVFHALKRVYPKARTRRALLFDVFGLIVGPGFNINNSKEDRKIRLAIASMFDKGIPVVSSSGSSGYCIQIDAEKWTVMVNELESRKVSIEGRLHTAKIIQAKIRRIGLEVIPPTVPSTPKQLSLLEVEA